MVKKTKYVAKFKKFAENTEDDIKVFVEIKIDDSMKELLENFAVLKKGKAVKSRFGDKRYLVKNALMSSDCWRDDYLAFFQTELLDNKVSKIEMENLNEYNRFITNISNFKQTIKNMKELLNEDVVELEVTLKENKVEQEIEDA